MKTQAVLFGLTLAFLFSDYVLRVISNVTTNDLEQTLLALPFADALKLLTFLNDWTINPDKIELVCSVATALLQTHHNQLIATQNARPILTLLKDAMYASVKECKDVRCFNLAAMHHHEQLLAARSDVLFQDAKSKLEEIRSQQSKRLLAREDPKFERKKKKK